MIDELYRAGQNRRQFLQTGAALTGALLLPTGLRAQPAKPRKGGTLRVSMPYNPAALDPMTGRNTPDFNAVYTIFDALIEFDPITLDLKPGLAKSWRFTDPLTLVLDIIEGVEFHDGTPLNVEAVKFNMDRYASDPRSNVKSDFATVSGVEISGKNEITMHLKKPNAGLPLILTNRIGLMVSPTSVKKAEGGNVDRLPVGTGAFKFSSWQDNNLISVKRNENYWKSGLPYLDGIEFRIINERNTAARAVIAGEADLALNMTPQQKMVADRTPGIVATASPSLIFYGAHFNYAQSPLSDLRIRQALNWAIDRNELNLVSMNGLGEPSSGMFPASFWANDPETFNYYSFDPDRAKHLLAQAGYSGGLEITSWGWPDQPSVQRQEVIMAQLAKSGIRLKMTVQQPAQVGTEFYTRKKGAMYIAPSGGYPDPSMAYDALYSGDAFLNAASIELPGYRELLDKTMAAQDRDERKAALAAMQRYMIEQALELPQFIAPSVSIASPKVKDFVYGLLTCPKFHEVWMEA